MIIFRSGDEVESPKTRSEGSVGPGLSGQDLMSSDPLQGSQLSICGQSVNSPGQNAETLSWDR